MITSSMLIAPAASCARGKGGDKFGSNSIFGGLSNNKGFFGRVLFRNVEGFCCRRIKPKFPVAAMVKDEKENDDDPLWPDPEDIDPNCDTPLTKYLSYFHCRKHEVKPLTFSFQKPFIDLDENIERLRKAVEESGLDFLDLVDRLESKNDKAFERYHRKLTQNQCMAFARHPHRPDVVDRILNITETWQELHGDRTSYDPAIVTGLGSIHGEIYMFIGHQRNRKLKSAVPTPRSYKKALLMMKYAEHYGFPIVIFVDTTSAFPDLKSEELSQEEAIAHNLRTMFSLKVPIVTIVTGEGGPGGALAIACANKLLMMQRSAFYVARQTCLEQRLKCLFIGPNEIYFLTSAEILQQLSPAARKRAEQRAKKRSITAQEHYRLRIAGGVIWEPIAGPGDEDPWSHDDLKSALLEVTEELRILDGDELMHHRMLKFPTIRHGGDKKEGGQVRTKKKHRMKPSEVNVLKTAEMESQLEELTKKILKAEGTFNPKKTEMW
ncbi:OLC1v1004031C1 [Oldenlandia corymbosa var. corymbosa]|uniref:acetyl-CoA carboxytransferase n=1 Tax=Oldenlandia corymbosa var. corymbosa TaxID=529605 RepID=A0AAV1DBC9_OLDCO|nr:OLC1v1004031C1 [Oldenlandia corymbosa var. corymbosa]